MRSLIRYLALLLATGALMVSGQFNSAGADAEMKEVKTLSIYSALTGEYAELPAIQRSSAEWKEVLTDEQFYILRKEGTERPFTGKLLKEYREGVFKCAACGTDLFSSATRYDSGTGWPSYWEPVAPGNIREVNDDTFFMRRVEVECARCGGHLGHVFEDGPQPTGLRYCINSASLTFAAGKPVSADKNGRM